MPVPPEPADPSRGAPSDVAAEPAPYGRLPVGSRRQVWARRAADEAEAKAIASPLRLRILRITLHEPRTNKEIAEALDLNPASALHHVRTLVDTGFLIEQHVRRGPRGSRERPYLASGKSWYLDMGDVEGADQSDLLLTTFLQEIKGIDHALLDTARLGFRLRPEGVEEVQARLHALLEEIARMPSDPAGEPWSLFLALHPEATGVASAHELDGDH